MKRSLAPLAKWYDTLSLDSDLQLNFITLTYDTVQ